MKHAILLLLVIIIFGCNFFEEKQQTISFEASLYLSQLLYGKEIAKQLASGLVIDWNINNVPHLVIEQ